MILMFLLFDILLKAQLLSVNNNFFDKNNSQAMRGFWCIVVVLVHVPLIYQNRIQDMIGSFAYIGVTFFFMTSAYGVSISYDKKPVSIATFWRRRLPKLVITCWCVNILFTVIKYVLFGNVMEFWEIFSINNWVKWLISCYFAFWISSVLLKNRLVSRIVTCILVSVASITIYFLIKYGIIRIPAWAPECYGFIWGIMLT